MTPKNVELFSELSKNSLLSNSFTFEDETEGRQKSSTQRNVPPVKKKMLWKQKKKSFQHPNLSFQTTSNDDDDDDDIKFNDDELDVPKEERLFVQKPAKIKSRRKSKSDWNLYQSRENEEDEHSSLLISKNNVDTQKSQYFDAMETISEEEESEELADELDVS
jgi:hypothetical protein